jgi:hypothetical protein
MNRGIVSIILTCTGVFFLVGCTQTMRFKVVDAECGLPLSGVSISARQVREKMFRPVKQVGPINLPPSGKNGIIETAGLHRSWVSQFVFSCPGYLTVYGDHGTAQGGNLWLSTRVSFFTANFPGDQFAGIFHNEGNAQLAVESNGCFVVAMQKSKPPTHTTLKPTPTVH